MKEEAWDKLLIRLALLAPLLLVALSKWQDSLITWYVPWSGSTATYFDDRFEQDVRALPDVGRKQGATLFFISDRACPCTRATLGTLQAAMVKADRKDLRLVMVDVNDPLAKSPQWSRLLRQLPATPTLLITEGQRLVYGGPVNSGNLCTTKVQEILGLSALQSAPQRPVINWLEKGCYCRLQETGKPERAVAKGGRAEA
jgi:hypothetical protein